MNRQFRASVFSTLTVSERSFVPASLFGTRDDLQLARVALLLSDQVRVYSDRVWCDFAAAGWGGLSLPRQMKCQIAAIELESHPGLGGAAREFLELFSRYFWRSHFVSVDGVHHIRDREPLTATDRAQLARHAATLAEAFDNQDLPGRLGQLVPSGDLLPALHSGVMDVGRLEATDSFSMDAARAAVIAGLSGRGAESTEPGWPIVSAFIEPSVAEHLINSGPAAGVSKGPPTSEFRLTAAANLGAALPGVASLRTDDILHIREELAASLLPLRAVLLELATEFNLVADWPSQPHQVQDIYARRIGPAIEDVRRQSRAARWPRVLADTLERPPAVMPYLALAALRPAAVTLATGALALHAGYRAFRERARRAEQTQGHPFYFAHKISALDSRLGLPPSSVSSRLTTITCPADDWLDRLADAEHQPRLPSLALPWSPLLEDS